MALNCRITKGVDKACGFKPGGIKYMAFANLKDVAITNDTDGIIEANAVTISENSTMETGEKLFKVFEIADQTGVASSTVQVGGSKDSKSILHTVGGQVIGFGQGTDGLAKLIGDEYANWVLSDMVCVVKQADGEVVIFGWENGMKADNFDYTTGTAETDVNGITFQFSGTQYLSPIIVSGKATAWDALIAIEKD